MAECILMKKGGGAYSDDLTASTAQVLKGYTYIGNDTNDEAAAGNMANNGAVTKAITPAVQAQSFAIAEGYHNGNGRVNVAAIPNQMDGLTVYARTTEQTILTAPKYVKSNIKLAAISATNFDAKNVKKGTTINISNGRDIIGSITGTLTPVCVQVVSREFSMNRDGDLTWTVPAGCYVTLALGDMPQGPSDMKLYFNSRQVNVTDKGYTYNSYTDGPITIRLTWTGAGYVNEPTNTISIAYATF